jgi:hypothetical protein
MQIQRGTLMTGTLARLDHIMYVTTDLGQAIAAIKKRQRASGY